MESEGLKSAGRNGDSGELNGGAAAHHGALDLGAVPDLLREDLRILFIGINPGLRSGATGNHFAGRSNRFWRFLHESGLTPEKYRPEEGMRLLLDLGYGITNLAPRVTATAAELTATELREGGVRLLDVLRLYRPRVAAYLGKVVYQSVSRRSRSSWGRQTEPVVDGIVDFVMPNPSGLNRMPIPEQLELYRALRCLVAEAGAIPASNLLTDGR